jgi:hypothetical protein
MRETRDARREIVSLCNAKVRRWPQESCSFTYGGGLEVDMLIRKEGCTPREHRGRVERGVHAVRDSPVFTSGRTATARAQRLLACKIPIIRGKNTHADLRILINGGTRQRV